VLNHADGYCGQTLRMSRRTGTPSARRNIRPGGSIRLVCRQTGRAANYSEPSAATLAWRTVAWRPRRNGRRNIAPSRISRRLIRNVCRRPFAGKQYLLVITDRPMVNRPSRFHGLFLRRIQSVGKSIVKQMFAASFSASTNHLQPCIP
jgi:hypothetical protein